MARRQRWVGTPTKPSCSAKGFQLTLQQVPRWPDHFMSVQECDHPATRDGASPQLALPPSLSTPSHF